MGNKNNKAKDNTLLGNIKSNYILQEITKKIKEKKILKIIKYNKKVQKRLNKDINNYKFYFFKNKGFNIKFIGGNIPEDFSYIFEKIKNNKKILKSKINYKLKNIISLTTNKNNTLNLIDINKDKKLKNKYMANCIILEFNVNDMENFSYIEKYYYENIRHTFEDNLIYLIGVNYNLKDLQKEITYYDNIKEFAKSNKINLISFNKDYNINKLLNEIEDNLMEEINEKLKDKYKVVFVGDGAIGAKTSLINRIVSNSFSRTLFATSGLSFAIKNFKIKNGKEIKLEMWDTSYKLPTRALARIIYKNSDCIVLGYDITFKSSFEDAKNCWYPIIKIFSKLIYLIGCKKDLYENRKVSSDEAEEFAKENNLRFFEVSNINNIGIDEFVEDLTNEIIK